MLVDIVIGMQEPLMKTHRFLEYVVMHVLSDVHMDYGKDGLHLTFRKHKKTVSTRLDKTLDIFVQLKRLAGFDVSFKGAQTGVFEWIIHDRSYHFRFAAIEQNHHVSGVLRVLNIHQVDDLSAITNDHAVLEKVKTMMNQRFGIVLITGKTGSGKSTSLFYFLNYLTTRMVYTLENPIERINPEWVQIETNNYETALIQLLRHDPDVIVLGEIRSKHDIGALIHAGLSGHFVVTTMHAGSINQAIRRLLDLGVSALDLAEMLVGIIHQDLVSDEKGDFHALFDLRSSDEIKTLLAQT